ncbi:MAG: hypothetical protein AAGI70_11775 [Pseudomonadota bacterium]
MKYALTTLLILGLAACGDTRGQRAITGAAIGAGTGVVGAEVLGADPLVGGVFGALGGAAIGAGTVEGSRGRRFIEDRRFFDDD